MTGLSVIAAALPVLVYVLGIWWLDRYEREPFWIVALTFLYGATVSVYLALAGSAAIRDLLDASLIEQVILVAPLAEEPAKAGILFLLLLSRHFDNTTDGLVYGAAAGLGFAMTENYLYFQLAHEAGGVSGWTSVVIIRTLFSALMHCAATAAFGAVLGAFRYRGVAAQWLLAPALGLLPALAIHAGFNGALALGGESHDAGLTALGLGLVPVVGLTLFALTQVVLAFEHRMIHHELEAEARDGVLPKAHAAVLPYYFKRRGAEWLADYPTLDKAAYVRLATLLAFRRHQGKRARGQLVLADAERLRHQLRALLASGGNGHI